MSFTLMCKGPGFVRLVCTLHFPMFKRRPCSRIASSTSFIILVNASRDFANKVVSSANMPCVKPKPRLDA
eukprot:9246487-Karenia_brevis.AAC.1